MTEREAQLAQDRTLRESARGRFDHRLAQVRADLAARGIGGRIRDKAVDQGSEALAQGLDIARESRGVVAATATALTVWLFRKPLLALLGRAAPRGQVAIHQADDSDQSEQPE